MAKKLCLNCRTFLRGGKGCCCVREERGPLSSLINPANYHSYLPAASMFLKAAAEARSEEKRKGALLSRSPQFFFFFSERPHFALPSDGGEKGRKASQKRRCRLQPCFPGRKNEKRGNFSFRTDGIPSFVCTPFIFRAVTHFPLGRCTKYDPRGEEQPRNSIARDDRREGFFQ